MLTQLSLRSGDGDVSTTGDCASDIKFFCKTAKPGEGRISACLTNQLDQEENGAVTGRKISPPCAEELRAFKIDRRGSSAEQRFPKSSRVEVALRRPSLARRRAENINKDLKLAVACKPDAEKYCNASNIFPEPGAVLTCLRYGYYATSPPTAHTQPFARSVCAWRRVVASSLQSPGLLGLIIQAIELWQP